MKNTIAKLVARLAFLILFLTAGACTSAHGWSKRSSSPLPIEIDRSLHGQIASAQAYETSRHLYVQGVARHHFASNHASTAHVDVELIARNGKIIASQKEDIRPARSTVATRHRSPYVVRFPVEVARKSSKIRVAFDHSVSDD